MQLGGETISATALDERRQIIMICEVGKARGSLEPNRSFCEICSGNNRGIFYCAACIYRRIYIEIGRDDCDTIMYDAY